MNKTVELNVDGHTSEVRTFAHDVGGVLDAEGVSTGQHDLVSPSLSSSVSKGSDIVVRHGRKLSLTVDGKSQVYWTTASTVGGALKGLGIRAGDGRLSASRSESIGRQGLSVRLSTSKSVKVLADGKVHRVSSAAATVGEAVKAAGVSLGSGDRLSVPAGSPVVAGSVVQVFRVSKKHESTTKSIDHDTTRKESDDLFKGQTKVKTEGADGVRTVKFATRVVNGQVVSKSKVSSKVTKKPVTEVVLVGTKEKPAPEPSESSSDSSSSHSSTSTTPPSSTTGTAADSLNWTALAQCESGGNPRAVNGNGHYGLYQFSLQTWHAMGGSGNPINASPATQLALAKKLYNAAGSGQWSCGSHLYD
nr:resuscitation-promoting factor [Spelaeicoccus albus]